MKKIKIFTNHFYPESFRINDIAQSLSQEFDVSVVTQIPNYPGGRFLPGYSCFKNKVEKVGNVEVRRLPVIPRFSNSMMLFLNYVSYIISSFFYGMFSRETADLSFIYITSPIFVSWSALRFSKRRNIPKVMYLLDLWPDNLITMLNIRSPFIINRLEKMCAKIYQQCDLILISSQSFKEDLMKYGVDHEKIIYFPQHEKVSEEILEIRKDDRKLNVLFAGNIGEAQGLDILVDVAVELKKMENQDIEFQLLGDGRYKAILEQKIKDRDVERYFKLYGRVTKEEVRDYMEKAHFGLVSLEDDETLNKHLPAKVQTYMANGLPILALARNEIPFILEESRAGVCTDPGDVQGFLNLLIELTDLKQNELQAYSLNGYKYAKMNYDKELLMNRLVTILEGEIAHV